MTTPVSVHEVATDTGAVAALFIPAWLPSLDALNQDIAAALPWLGATWLIIQITWRLFPLVVWAHVKWKTRKATK